MSDRRRALILLLASCFLSSAVLVSGSTSAQAIDKNTQRIVKISKTFETKQYFNMKCGSRKWTTVFAFKWTKLSSKKARLDQVKISAGKHQSRYLVLNPVAFSGNQVWKANPYTVYLKSGVTKTYKPRKTFSTKGSSKWLGQFRPAVSTQTGYGGCIPIGTYTVEFRMA